MTGGAAGLTQFGIDWEWDGVNWSQAQNANSLIRYAHALAFDSHRNRMVQFGGATNGSLSGTSFSGSTTELIFSVSPGTPFGSGCGSPSPTLQPDPTSPPSTGSTARCLLGTLASPVAVMMIGWSNSSFGAFSLPVSLAAVGMPGCNLLQSAEVFGLSVSSTGPAVGEFALPIPADSALVGYNLYLQALVVTPGANPANLLTTNGLTWEIGL